MSRVLLQAEITALPGRAGRIRTMLVALTEHVRAETGNVVFAASERVDEPGTFFVYEEYMDEHAFETHLAADYGARFNAELVHLAEGGASRLRMLRELANG